MSHEPQALRSRILAAVAGEESPTRRDVRRGSLVAMLVAVAVVAVAFELIGGANLGDRSHELVAVALGALGVALALGFAASGDSVSSHLTPPRAVLIAALPALALATTVLVGRAAETGAAVPASVHLACALVTAFFATPPGMALVYSRRRSDPVHPARTAATVVTAAAAMAAALALVHCPHANLQHDLLGHALPAVVPAIVALVLGGGVVRP